MLAVQRQAKIANTTSEPPASQERKFFLNSFDSSHAQNNAIRVIFDGELLPHLFDDLQQNAH